MNFISNPANCRKSGPSGSGRPRSATSRAARAIALPATWRSEEHTSELQSRLHLVCRLLLEKKKKKKARLQALMTTINQIPTGDHSDNDIAHYVTIQVSRADADAVEEPNHQLLSLLALVHSS